jgi:hypothetical protein
MDLSGFGKPFYVRIGNTGARCQCGGDLFVRSRRIQREKTDVLICASCAAQHYYTNLLAQIARETIRHADEVLNQAERVRAARKNRFQSRH